LGEFNLSKSKIHEKAILGKNVEIIGNVEIGPINTFYQYNSVEGMRLRFGGRTTDTFSKKLTLESYGAYGFLDERWKYYLGGAWSLTDHNSQKFPVKTIRMSYQQETQFPGQEMKFLMEDNFLLSIKRGETDKLFYNKIFKFEHLNEFENHFSYLVGYKYTSMEPGGNLFYNYTDYSARTNDVAKINVPEFVPLSSLIPSPPVGCGSSGAL
jgi:hypothetical protein